MPISERESTYATWFSLIFRQTSRVQGRKNTLQKARMPLQEVQTQTWFSSTFRQTGLCARKENTLHSPSVNQFQQQKAHMQQVK